MVKFENRQHPTEAKGVVEYVLIESSGTDVVHRPANDEDRRLHPYEYELFKSGEEAPAAAVEAVPAVSFELRVNPNKPDLGPIEYVRILVGQDVVHRPATDEDRAQYAKVYEAFKPSEKTEKPASENTASYTEKERALVDETKPALKSVHLTPVEQAMEEQLEELAGTKEDGPTEATHHHKKKKK